MKLFYRSNRAINKNPEKPTISVIRVRKILEARAGSRPNFLKSSGMDAPERFPIKILNNIAIPSGIA